MEKMLANLEGSTGVTQTQVFKFCGGLKLGIITRTMTIVIYNINGKLLHS